MTEIEMIEKLNKAREAYYNIGTSTLSDLEFDSLEYTLSKYYPESEYFKKVGSSEKGEHWKKMSHGNYKMGSLSKVNTIEEFYDWSDKQPQDQFILQEKLDGISIRLVYSEGNLIAAITRGNGNEGEDIYRNVKCMKGIPSKIKNEGHLIIRAEIIMTHSDFRKLPEELKMKNPRNATTGIAKRLDSTYAKYLTVICTEVMSLEWPRIDAMNFLAELGFITVFSEEVSSKEVKGIYNYYITEKREKLDYDIDGLVIKGYDMDITDMKDNWEHPKTQIALKFKNQYKETILRNVIWQYKGNRITPVGIYDPIELAGATCDRVTLNNIEFIEEMKLKIGSKVLLTRANEVIPKLTEVLEYGNIDIIPPSLCPECGNAIIRKGKFFYCSNDDCATKAIRKIIAWLEAHDSKGVAVETINALYDSEVITNLIDFLILPNDDSRNDFVLEGFGERKKQILFDEIKKTYYNNMIQFLDGLNFQDMGIKKWKSILDYFANYAIVTTESLFDAIEKYDLTLIPGLAEESSKKIKESYKQNEVLIDELLKIIEVEDYVKESNMSMNKLNGQSFCFTGPLNSMKRPDAQKLVEDNGGINKSAVNASLNYLVTNELSNSAKSKAAIALGIKVINEQEFLEMLK